MGGWVGGGVGGVRRSGGFTGYTGGTRGLVVVGGGGGVGQEAWGRGSTAWQLQAVGGG